MRCFRGGLWCGLLLVAATAACDGSPVETLDSGQEVQESFQESVLEISTWAPDETGKFRLASAVQARLRVRGAEVLESEILDSDITIPDLDLLTPAPRSPLPPSLNGREGAVAEFRGFRNTRWPIRDLTMADGTTARLYTANSGTMHLAMADGSGVRFERPPQRRRSGRIHVKMSFFDKGGRVEGVVQLRSAGDDRLASAETEAQGVLARVGSFVDGVVCRVGEVLGPSVLHAATIQQDCSRQVMEVYDAGTAFAGAVAFAGLTLLKVEWCFSSGMVSIAACGFIAASEVVALGWFYWRLQRAREDLQECRNNSWGGGIDGRGDGGGDEQDWGEYDGFFGCEEEWWCFRWNGGGWVCNYYETCWT